MRLPERHAPRGGRDRLRILWGFRTRLILTLVGLVALTAATLGIGAYGYVATSLRQEHRTESLAQARFNIEVLAAQLSPAASLQELARSGLAEAFERRGAQVAVEFEDGEISASSLELRAALGQVASELRAVVSAGNLGYQYLTLADRPALLVAGRRPPTGPVFYFLFPADQIESAIADLGRALLGGASILILLGILVGGFVARGVLRPVRRASQAASRIEHGDLAARIPVEGADEFGAWAASFNRMAGSLETTLSQLRETQAQQRRFVADVSHELRTPVTALVSEASLIRDRLKGASPESRRLGDLLAADIARLRVLVEDLMEVSRIDASVDAIQWSEVDLGRFLQAIVAARLPNAELRLPEAPLIMNTDPRRLERIVGNILDNARKHAIGHEVQVNAAQQGAWLMVQVADRGPGVDPKDLPRLFERFYKADPARGGEGSSGLGLAIAREHAQALGGTLEARLRRDGGLIFELRLPVTRSLPARDRAVTDVSHLGVPSEPEAAPLHWRRE